MLVYVGQTRSRLLIEELRTYGWGEMTTGNEVPPRREPWAMDNGAFGAWKAKKPWNEARFVRAVEFCVERRLRPDFVVVPDKVAGGVESLEISLSWVPRLRGFAPMYLAVQDGMQLTDVSPVLRHFDGLFVGGGLEWKTATSWWWVALAHGAGRPCHVGRVSGRRRVRWARSIGADSIDSCVPLWSKENRFAVLKGLADPLDVELAPPLGSLLAQQEAT